MSIRHTIRTGSGSQTVEVKLTTRTAIRRACIECMGFLRSEVERCTAPLCPLYPFRTGHLKTGRAANPQGVQALKEHKRLTRFGRQDASEGAGTPKGMVDLFGGQQTR